MKCKARKKNSPFFKKNTISKIVGIVFIFVFGIYGQVHAQMFSVGSQGPRFNTPLSEFYMGVESMTVDYQGGSIPGSGESAFEFDGPIIRLGYNSSSFDFFLGTGGEISRIEEASYFDIGGNIDFGINIIRSKKLTLELPFRIASRYTNITSDVAFGTPTLSRFQFGSLTAGAGARLLVRPKSDFRIEVGAIPSYGFSFSSDGFSGGSLGSITGLGRLYFDHLFGDIGLSVGYNYDLRNYNLDDEVYDYKITGHSFELGITF